MTEMSHNQSIESQYPHNQSIESQYPHNKFIDDLLDDKESSVDQPLLHKACKLGDINQIRYILSIDREAMDSMDTNCQTPIYHAISINRIDIVWTLILYGATLNLIDRYGFSPLHKSIIDKHYEITMLLLIQGARIDCDLLILFRKGMEFIINSKYKVLL